MATLAALLVLATGVASHDGTPIDNPLLGVGGFPDCIQPMSSLPSFNATDADANALTLECAQRARDRDGQILIGTVGDSITAGVCSSGPNETWPAQLQAMIGDGYKVTNLGACGSTMMKDANSPYWRRPQHKALISAKWDIITIMLGTNDAKDQGSGGPANWPHDCTGDKALECSYAKDYMSMIELVRTLGTSPNGPKVYVLTPPPLMKNTVYGMNGTVINRVLPGLVAAIGKEAKVDGIIDVFDAMGGKTIGEFPSGGCTLTSTLPTCPLWCDKQSCDQCHPNNNGYTVLASAVKAGLGI